MDVDLQVDGRVFYRILRETNINLEFYGIRASLSENKSKKHLFTWHEMRDTKWRPIKTHMLIYVSLVN